MTPKYAYAVILGRCEVKFRHNRARLLPMRLAVARRMRGLA